MKHPDVGVVTKIRWAFSRLKWKLIHKVIALGFTDATAYYFSPSHGDDENSGLSKAEAVATYDEAQGRLNYRRGDIIITLDQKATG